MIYLRISASDRHALRCNVIDSVLNHTLSIRKSSYTKYLGDLALPAETQVQLRETSVVAIDSL